MQNHETLGAVHTHTHTHTHTPHIYIYTHHGRISDIENYVRKELNRVKINEDLRNDEGLSLICDIEKIKRTSYLNVVRKEERKEKLELQKNSCPFSEQDKEIYYYKVKKYYKYITVILQLDYK